MRIVNLLGKRFGRLTVIKKEKSEGGNKWWLCRCDCGNETILRTNDLTSGKTKSCGCFQREQTSKARKKHGLSHSRLFRIWECMKRRTLDKENDNYSFYGGRGISVCEEWIKDSSSFFEWALKNGYNDSLTLDRIDNNGNYSPENCRWITHKEQCRNRRSNKTITINGKELCISEIAECYGIRYGTLWARIKRGVDIKEAIAIPTREYSKKNK